jgi:hypothetical protein
MIAAAASPPAANSRPATPGSPSAAHAHAHAHAHVSMPAATVMPHVKPPPPALTPREQCEGDWEFWCELMDVMLNGGKMPARAKARAHARKSARLFSRLPFFLMVAAARARACR